MKKICKICGQEFETIKYGGKRIYCFECSPLGVDRQSAITSIRRRCKEIGVKKLGGSCKHCGENRSYLLDFHHRNPAEKENTLSDFSKGYNVDEFFTELEKCDLLCPNCHREFHYLNNRYGVSYEDYITNNFKISD